MTEDETGQRTLELSLSDDEYDRITAIADGAPEGFLETAVRSELRLREAMAAVEQRRDGSGEPLDAPTSGPLDSPVGALLGIEVVDIGEGSAVLAMDASSRHANRGGAMQGGVLTALADTATAFAFMTTLDDGQSTTNIELKINFLRPVFDDAIEATATVVERGRTIGLVQCDVRTAAGKLVARLSTTYMVLSGDRAEGR